MRGNGMIANSSTFRPHPGRVIRDLFRQVHAVWNGTGTLVYSNHPRGAAAYSYLAIIFGRIASGVPWFLRSTTVLMQLSHQCWSYLEGVILPIVTLGLSDPRIAELREMPRSSGIKVSGRLGMSSHVQNPLSGERRKTLSITHHALPPPPPPSHHYLYIITSYQLTTTFLSYYNVT